VTLRGSRRPGALASAEAPAQVASRALGGLEVPLRNTDKLVPGGDLELLEDLVQVVLHGPRADEELRADLGVRQARLGQAGDLRLLRGEHAARVAVADTRGLPRRAELVPGARGEGLD